MNPIETNRLLIRNFNEGDWPAFREVIVAYQASDSAKYEPAWPTSAEEMQSMTKWFAGGDDFLCVALKATGVVIGMLAIERRKAREDHARNLGYIFHPAYYGHGYATEGCRAIMQFVFNELGAEAILTGTNPANEASVRLLMRMGLKRINEGEFTMSRDEWRAMNNQTPS